MYSIIIVMQKKKLKTVKYISKNIIYIFPLHSYIHIYKYEYVKLLDKMSSNKKCRRPFERSWRRRRLVKAILSHYIDINRYLHLYNSYIDCTIWWENAESNRENKPCNNKSFKSIYSLFIFVFYFVLFLNPLKFFFWNSKQSVNVCVCLCVLNIFIIFPYTH